MVCFKSYLFPPSSFGIRQRLSDLPKKQISLGQYFVDLLRYFPMLETFWRSLEVLEDNKFDPEL